ncbi:MAG: ligase [Segetibacter sp.]|nr:ligase [Segetibacter sp.]
MQTRLLKLIQKEGVKNPFPTQISPMLCTLVKEPINDPEYLYEIKWDGYRIISFVKKNTVTMGSRSGLDYTKKYPPVAEALKKLRHDVVLDGEIVVFNEEGHPDFEAVQNFNGHDTPISYCLFDIVWLDGYDLKLLPLTDRKTILKDLLKGNEVLRFSDSFDDGPGLYEQMKQMNLEGIVAKKRDSRYREGERINDWLKIPTRKRQEFVIGGWAESERGRSFRSLLFGAYKKGKLKWIGRSGGGYKDKDMPGILAQLKKLETKKSPFTNKVLDTKGAVIHWVKPKLVAIFEFATWTKSGRIRKPATFIAFRNDKDPTQVVMEIPIAAEEVESEPETGKADKEANNTRTRFRKEKPSYLNVGSNWVKVDEEQRSAEWTDFEMEECTIPVHNLDRELWHGISKGKLLLYYSNLAKWILPYVKDHPLSLVLKLTHAGGPKIFIKDMENRQPECASIFTDKRRVKKSGKRDTIDYLVCNNLETLIYMVDLGCVDINPWASRTPEVNYPDYIWLDLDPTIPEKLTAKALDKAEQTAFAKAIDVALAAKQVLDKLKLTGFIKTSGQTGLHIYVPCSGFDFKQARTLGSMLADRVHALVPDISTRNESISLRDENVYIDAGQNDYADTLAAPYCIRPYHAPLVSTPLEWKELNSKLDRYAFTMDSIGKRLIGKGDLFKGVLSGATMKKNNVILRKLFID